MRQAWTLGFLLRRRQPQGHPITIHPADVMDVHRQDEALRLHQQMPLAPVEGLFQL
jgi:hypothetical protein